MLQRLKLHDKDEAGKAAW